jgi:hypothetical protein
MSKTARIKKTQPLILFNLAKLFPDSIFSLKIEEKLAYTK